MTRISVISVLQKNIFMILQKFLNEALNLDFSTRIRLQTKQIFANVNRYADAAVTHLSSISGFDGFGIVLSTDGCLDPINRECALA